MDLFFSTIFSLNNAKIKYNLSTESGWHDYALNDSYSTLFKNNFLNRSVFNTLITVSVPYRECVYAHFLLLQVNVFERWMLFTVF